MTATLREAQDVMFECMENLLAATHDVCVLDPGIDIRATYRGMWLRGDGTSIGFEQTLPNEMTFVLQVPMDAVLAIDPDTDPNELIYKDNL